MMAIAALTANRVIGHCGKLPWHLPEDFRFFKQTTLGHVVVMGRRTFDSIGRPLPGRENWVISRGPAIAGVRMLGNPSDVGETVDGRTVYVIGGAAIYEALLPRCSELILTHVHGSWPGDTFFPEYTKEFGAMETLLENPDFTVIRHVRLKGAGRIP
jgi:dihydrofolate reductase